MRLKLVACEIFYRELCAAIARSVNQVDVEFLPKGLHDLGSAAMRARLQQAVDGAEGQGYETVVLGYALCGNGLVGLTAGTVSVIVPKAHDCITLFMGSKDRYLDYFNSHSGVYFKTTGWIERGQALGPQMSFEYDALVARYGEFVLLKPPLQVQTLLLWAAPPLVLLCGAIALFVGARRRKTQSVSAEATLSGEEQRRIAALVKPGDKA